MDITAVSLVILGASGDLTKRLLLPGLATLLKAKSNYDVTLIGAAMDDLTADEWSERVKTALTGGGLRDSRVEAMLGQTHFSHLDVTDPEALKAFLGELDAQGRPIVLYFALPPAISQKACEAMTKIELPDGIRLCIEKPFGSSLESAREFNRLLATLVPEKQIFRIDHYLGKATVLNLLGLRFGNRFFEPVWDARSIERVEIVGDETLALEGRAGYYDHSGAARDMIQSHLMLVMAFFAMEEPSRIEELEVRDLIAHTLRATRVWGDDGVAASRRARYTAGEIDGKQIPNYVDEPGVDPANDTETLAEITLEINNSRWRGVPFRLRSGKALGDGLRGVSVMLRPLDFVPAGFSDVPPANVLQIGIAPERILMGIATNGEGDRWDFEQTALAADLGESPIRPYGEILDGVLAGDPLLSVRGDVAEECWRILTPVFDAWARGDVPMDEYRAGSSGPDTWK